MATEKNGNIPCCFADLFQRGTGLYQMRKYSYSCKVREETGKQGCSVSYQCGNQQQFPGTFTDVGNGYGNQSHNNQRYGEIQKFAEDTVECNEQAYQFSGKKITKKNTECDGYKDTRQ